MPNIFFRGGVKKIQTIFQLFPEIFQGNVLDVGCGDAYLRNLISGKYTGIDFAGKADIVKDISSGLPFSAKSFDTVVAFDILEHMENPHFIFDELCRVSQKWVIVTLPNMYEWRFRLSFLFGRIGSGKYGLPSEYIKDRHRWLFSLKEANSFIKARALKNGLQIYEEMPCYYQYNKLVPKIISKIGSTLGKKYADIFASHGVFVLMKQ